MLELFQQLYMLSSDNAELMESQFLSVGGQLMKDYRQKIIYEFFPPANPHNSFPRMGEIKKWIRDYRKGTEDLAGTAELMLTFQEQGMFFTMEYGDIDERFTIPFSPAWTI